MSRIVTMTGTILLPEGHTYADATWRYATDVAGDFHAAGGAVPLKIIETPAGSGLGEVRTPDGKPFKVLAADIGDFVSHYPYGILEVRFRGLSVGFERNISLVLTREETSLRLDKQIAKARLIELKQNTAVFLNWRFDAENYILVDGVTDSVVALTPKDIFKGHKHTWEDVTGLTTALNSKAVETSVAQRLANKADLIGGKIPTSQLPGAALSEIFFVSSDAQMLALRAEPGDIAVRTDKGNLRYELTGDSTNLDHWSPQFPAGADGSAATGVTSINNQRGDVILGYNDVGAAAASHTHTHSQITDWDASVDNRAEFNVIGKTSGGIKAEWDKAKRQNNLSINGADSGFSTALLTALTAGTGITITPDENTGKPRIAVSGSGGWVDWNDVAHKPTKFAPDLHAATHKTGGADALSAADIGAAAANHSHTPASIGAAAKDHQHVPNDMPDLAEFVRDTIGATLAGSNGIVVTNNDAGDQIMISASGVVGVTLEESDGNPSLSASKIIVPPNSLTQISPGVVQLNVGSSSGSSGGSMAAYSPTYKRSLTVTNPFPYRTEISIQAVVRTAFAQSDGRDMQVYTQGNVMLPTAVRSALPGPNYSDYFIAFADTLNASETRTYAVRYGDPFAPERNIYSDTLTKLLSRPTRTSGNLVVQYDPSLGFRPSDFLISSPAWYASSTVATGPGVNLRLAGVNASNFLFKTSGSGSSDPTINAGGIEMVPISGTVAPRFMMSADYSNLITPTQATNNANGLGDPSTTGYCVVGHALSDGYVFDIRTTYSPATAYHDISIRYRAGIGWIWTLHHVNGNPPSGFIEATQGVTDSAGGFVKFFGPNGIVTYSKPNRNDPRTWHAFTIDYLRNADATAGDETPYTP